jgi:Uma2 family endonuclease
VAQRVQVAKTRIRVPDVWRDRRRKAPRPIFRTLPFICIEVLSPEDRMAGVQDRIYDYLKFGVRYLWVINPENRRVWVNTLAGATEVKGGILRTENPSLTVSLAELFAGLDE